MWLRWPSRIACMIALAAASSGPALAQQLGPVSGLPLPRFASLKTDRVNLREGPSTEHATRAVYQQAGLPVEILAEFETWRRIRDSEGAEGWVLHSLLSGRRTALVAPWRRGELLALRSEPAKAAQLAARLEPGVVGSVKDCNGSWCRLTGQGYDGFIEQTNIWGVYPGDTLK